MIMSGTTPRLVSVWGGLGSLCLAVLLLPVNATWAQQPEKPQQVRIIVKTDEDSVKPDDEVIEIRSPDGSTVTGKIITMDVRGDEPREVVAALEGVDQGQIALELQIDDSSVKVIAGSPEEAIKKLNEQLKAIEQKSSPSEKDKALLKALEQVLDQLKQIKAKSPDSGSLLGVKPADPKATAAKRVVIRRVETSTDTSSSPDKKAEISKLRDEVKKLTDKLAAAQLKLSQLERAEAKSAVVHLDVRPGTAIERVYTTRLPADSKDGTVRFVIERPKDGSSAKAGAAAAGVGVKVLKVNPKLQHSGDWTIKGSEEQRIQELEKTLKKLMQEVESLKKARAK